MKLPIFEVKPPEWAHTLATLAIEHIQCPQHGHGPGAATALAFALEAAKEQGAEEGARRAVERLTEGLEEANARTPTGTEQLPLAVNERVVETLSQHEFPANVCGDRLVLKLTAKEVAEVVGAFFSISNPDKPLARDGELDYRVVEHAVEIRWVVQCKACEHKWVARVVDLGPGYKCPECSGPRDTISILLQENPAEVEYENLPNGEYVPGIGQVPGSDDPDPTPLATREEVLAMARAVEANVPDGADLRSRQEKRLDNKAKKVAHRILTRAKEEE